MTEAREELSLEQLIGLQVVGFVGYHVDEDDMPLHVKSTVADILAALTAAGWTLAPPGSRVVPEGGVDRETVLKCIALIEQSWKPVGAGDGQTFVVGCGGGTAALRALAEAKP